MGGLESEESTDEEPIIFDYQCFLYARVISSRAISTIYLRYKR